jgi:hypothetical protein
MAGPSPIGSHTLTMLTAPITGAETPSPDVGDVSPRWLGDMGGDDADRTVLRRILGDGFDAHARPVARVLAERPGLRQHGAATALALGLIAVRAFCAAEREAVNRQLRGLDEESEDLRAFARCAAAGAGRGAPAHPFRVWRARRLPGRRPTCRTRLHPRPAVPSGRHR